MHGPCFRGRCLSRWLLLAALAVGVPAVAQDLLVGDWTSVNDGVMGGVSEGRVAVQEGLLVFEGRVSLENNGGFASARSATAALDAAALQFKLRVRGDGRRYRLTRRARRGAVQHGL